MQNQLAQREAEVVVKAFVLCMPAFPRPRVAVLPCIRNDLLMHAPCPPKFAKAAEAGAPSYACLHTREFRVLRFSREREFPQFDLRHSNKTPVVERHLSLLMDSSAHPALWLESLRKRKTCKSNDQKMRLDGIYLQTHVHTCAETREVLRSEKVGCILSV
mmetsp:Transcript_14596/g.20416  ORF Transcript_14596/g.20416 Transcript_14596/m.20416 type:complete len:160 (+) Transcript_14596:121-600(+)